MSPVASRLGSNDGLGVPIEYSMLKLSALVYRLLNLRRQIVSHVNGEAGTPPAVAIGPVFTVPVSSLPPMPGRDMHMEAQIG
jgi:hypothetical protein